MRKNKNYLDFIRRLPCIVCRAPSEPQHIRSQRHCPLEYAGGTSLKPYDLMSLPCCREHHVEMEQGYIKFEKKYNLDLKKEIIKCLVKYIERGQ